MNIIFKDNAKEIQEKYTVLDLDSFSSPDGSIQTACCVIENIPIMELSQTAGLKQLHADLIQNYGQKNWDYCEQAIEHLMGKWGGEIDTFYLELKKRIARLKTLDLDDNWSPVISKT